MAVPHATPPRAVLTTVTHANDESGTIRPIREAGLIARERGARFHTNAVQSVGKIPTRVAGPGAGLLSTAGHKLCAPKGVGALYAPACEGACTRRSRRL